MSCVAHKFSVLYLLDLLRKVTSVEQLFRASVKKTTSLPNVTEIWQFVTLSRRTYDMIWQRKTETYTLEVEFFFPLEYLLWGIFELTDALHEEKV